MLIENANQTSGSTDQSWLFLSEVLLDELINVEEKASVLTSGWLFQSTMGQWISPDCLKNMESKLGEFANQVLVRFHQGELKPPIVIRLFCQKKMVKGNDSARIANGMYLEQIRESLPMIHPTNPKTPAGWGYFLIERVGSSLTDSSTGSRHFIDLYFYREGA